MQFRERVEYNRDELVCRMESLERLHGAEATLHMSIDTALRLRAVVGEPDRGWTEMSLSDTNGHTRRVEIDNRLGGSIFFMIEGVYYV